jgi:S-adenosylmethionine:tRNA ribosyltransferase-isomerase
VKVLEFDYHLPEDRIALHPIEPRDRSRLMCVRRTTGEISHHTFTDLPALLQPGDLLVLNNTKVFPARLLGKRLGLTSETYARDKRPSATIEVFLLKPLGDDMWEALVKPGRKMRIGERVRFGEGQLEGEVIEHGKLGLRKLRFFYQGNFEAIVEALGHVPLPPYISRPDEPRDKVRYQTVYAREGGAVAAPTAGLHFTRALFEKLRGKSIETCEVTLHVGLGTFQPVHAEYVEEHRMESERFQISEEAADAIRTARFDNRRIIAVGTTVTRTLEWVALQNGGAISQASGETNLFIYPGFSFQCVDALLTNFHLPRSTLLMLVSAFASRELILGAYQQAIDAKYRFYSYGDCMLIL